MVEMGDGNFVENLAADFKKGDGSIVSDMVLG